MDKRVCTKYFHCPAANNMLILDGAMEVLRAYSLVHYHPDMKALSIHRLVQTVLKDTMQGDLQRQWAERVVRAIDQLFPHKITSDTWPLCKRYLLHAQA